MWLWKICRCNRSYLWNVFCRKTSWIKVLLWQSSTTVLEVLKAVLNSEPGSSWKAQDVVMAVWGQLLGAGQQEQSKMQGWIPTQSPHSPAARSTGFTLLVWLGMNGTALVSFQTGCTLPHYKLQHVLSSPLRYLPVSFKGNAGMQEGCFCWELFWAERTGKN